ncbi:DUF302 domain-containing protein [Thiohalorhabdus sp. Cl-TMA]|uniref:DUF302 domain-containing protein n=1 Tax=Thiohalorhabdus methylotrophus TaxID=3242694 RepID=A0ABV4TWB3_9GAMM
MIRHSTRLPPGEALERLHAAIEEADMRLVSHINGQAKAALVGVEVPADQILEVFRPDYAVRVWRACKPAGIEIPLRIHVYQETADGPTHVACRPPLEAFTPYGSAELDAIGEELNPVFEGILAAVPEEITP